VSDHWIRTSRRPLVISVKDRRERRRPSSRGLQVPRRCPHPPGPSLGRNCLAWNIAANRGRSGLDPLTLPFDRLWIPMFSLVDEDGAQHWVFWCPGPLLQGAANTGRQHSATDHACLGALRLTLHDIWLRSLCQIHLAHVGLGKCQLFSPWTLMLRLSKCYAGVFWSRVCTS